jgi:hypothetical protein
MSAVPIYVWNGTAWQETGPTIPASPIKYQASAPTSPSTGDIWVDSDGDVDSGSQQFQRFRFVASGGETSESGADANGAVLAYTPGAELVVLNGSTLVRGQDYTATNGTTISGLSPALVANDVLEVFSFIAFSVANTYTQAQVDGLVNAARAASGLVLLNTQTFTNAGIVSFPANTFTSTYNSYSFTFNCTGSTALDIQARLRAGGVDNSSTNYTRSNWEATGPINTSTNTGQTSMLVGSFYDSDQKRAIQSFTLRDAQVSGRYTSGMSFAISNLDTGAYPIQRFFGVNVTTSYDSITFLTNTGTITGSISCYGYNQ